MDATTIEHEARDTMERVRIPAVTGKVPEASVVARAQAAIAQLRQRGDSTTADVVVELLQALPEREAVPALDVLTTTETGDLIGVTGQTIKNWVKAGTFPGYRVGSRIMISRAVVEEYVHRARTSLNVEELSDEEAAELIREGRRLR